MSSTRCVEVVEKEVVKRGRPVRSKVVREVDWLSRLSSGLECLVLEVGVEAEKATKKAESEAEKAIKKGESEAAKATKKEAAKAGKKAEVEAAKATKKAEVEAAKATKKAEVEAAKAGKQAEAKAKKEAANAAKKTEVQEVEEVPVPVDVHHVEEVEAPKKKAGGAGVSPAEKVVKVPKEKVVKVPKEKVVKVPKEKVVKVPKEKVVEAPTAIDGELEAEEVDESPTYEGGGMGDSPIIEEEVHVKRFTHNGVKWLRDSTGVIYDMESQEEVGVWNEDTQEIEMYE